MSNVKQINSRLIKLAADILSRRNMPRPDEWPWPTRATQKLWGAAVKAERDADEQCRLWAIELKRIADELANEQPTHD